MRDTTTEEFINNSCKDDSPINTVSRIRNVLRNVGINLLIEKLWGNPLEDVWWVFLKLPDTDIFTNGKATSPEFSLAGAYAEFVERLQNQVHFFIRDRDFDDQLYEEVGFCHAPDERYVDISDVEKKIPENLRHIYRPMNYSSNSNYLGYFSNETPYYFKDKGDFITVPFYDMTNNLLKYIPLPFLKYYYGTNGMCSGNTLEEAVTQGICEIMERYVKRETLLRDTIHSNIPRDYLKKYERQYAIISKIESIGNYRIVIKDCSLGTEFPVLALILVDTENKAYFVNFGAHPIFEIALERCLTELLQGRTHIDYLPLTSFEYLNRSNKSRISTEDNISNIFASSHGVYPPSLFLEDNYENVPTWKEFGNNKDILRYVTSLIKKRGLDILIRDVSFLGFPSYHVIIPGLSECYQWNTKQYKRIGMKQEIRDLARHIHECDDAKLEKLLYFMEDDYAENKTLDMLTGLPVKNSFPWKKIKFDLFLTTAYYRTGRIKKAHQYLVKYLKYLTGTTMNKRRIKELNYYKCVRDYFSILMDGNNKDQVFRILTQVYGEIITKEIKEDLKNPYDAFQYYPMLSCWNCDDCKLSNHCYYLKTRDIHVRVKKYMKENMINQIELKGVFQNIV
jgi:ribosomal protein S12 methylthiotransferase accessory factor